MKLEGYKGHPEYFNLCLSLCVQCVKPWTFLFWEQQNANTRQLWYLEMISYLKAFFFFEYTLQTSKTTIVISLKTKPFIEWWFVFFT